MNDEPAASPRSFEKAALLFVATLVSMFLVGAQWAGVDLAREGLPGLLKGYSFALPLMAILLAHELGHFFAARIHRVDTSPPYFIPMPFTLIGTFGAVIRMRGAIRHRTALLDIGAAGPLSGLIVSIPVLVVGLFHSQVVAIDPKADYLFFGEPLLFKGLLYLVKGTLPAGHDLMMSPTAFAGWAGLLVTMMNLVPVGQLDGGHVAYALFGPKQDLYSRRVRRALLLVALGLGAFHGGTEWLSGASSERIQNGLYAGVHWGMWWLVLTAMTRFTGDRHPPVEPSELGRGRRWVAWLTLLSFVALFMPTWISVG